MLYPAAKIFDEIGSLRHYFAGWTYIILKICSVSRKNELVFLVFEPEDLMCMWSGYPNGMFYYLVDMIGYFC